MTVKQSSCYHFYVHQSSQLEQNRSNVHFVDIAGVQYRERLPPRHSTEKASQPSQLSVKEEGARPFSNQLLKWRTPAAISVNTKSGGAPAAFQFNS